MYDVFISHARDATHVTEHLVATLELHGLHAFAPSQIQVGALWAESLQSALLEARAFVAIVSHELMSTAAAQAELATLVALAENKSAPVFVLLLGSASTPYGLMRYPVTKLSVAPDGTPDNNRELNAFSTKIRLALETSDTDARLPARQLSAPVQPTDSAIDEELVTVDVDEGAETFAWDGNGAAASAAYAALSDLLIQYGSLDEADSRLREVVRTSELASKNEELAGAYEQLGILAQARGQYERAAQWYYKALNAYQKENIPARSAGTSHQLGTLAQAQGSHDEARHWYGRALEFYHEDNNPAGSAGTSHQLGVLAQAQGNYDEARHWYDRALEFYHEDNNPAGSAATSHQLGTLAQTLGQYDEARQWYHRALDANIEAGNAAGYAGTSHQLGVLAQAQGFYVEAEQWYETALSLNRNEGNLRATVVSLHQLGQLAFEQGDNRRATDSFRSAQDTAEQVGDREAQAAAMTALGQLLSADGKHEEATKWNYRALLLRSSLGRSDTATDLKLLARQQRQLGDKKFALLLEAEERQGPKAGA